MVDSAFELASRVVDVWAFHTETPETLVTRIQTILAPDEKCRAAQFRFGHSRRSFIVARGVLRILLGRYLKIFPSAVQFEYGLQGKPRIAERHGVEFSVSHADGVAVFAFTQGCAVGIDVERIRTIAEMQAIVNTFFSPTEAAELTALPSEERERAFFLCWTRKEAYLKATGDGLSVPLDSFHLDRQPDGSARIIDLAHDIQRDRIWSLHDLDVAPGFAGAVAYGASPRKLCVKPIAPVCDVLTWLSLRLS